MVIALFPGSCCGVVWWCELPEIELSGHGLADWLWQPYPSGRVGEQNAKLKAPLVRYGKVGDDGVAALGRHLVQLSSCRC